MESSIGSRHKEYEKDYDVKIIRRIPIVIRVDGRSFSRITRRLPRPYSQILMDNMANTMLMVSKKIDGTVFAYQQSDEITFVLRNDQTLDTEPFFGNRIQKIASIAASLTTLEFNKQLALNPCELTGDAIFDARVTGMPSISEAINNLIWRQQDCTRNAITNAALAELGRKVGRKTAARLLHGKGAKERKEILLEECGINFDKDYPLSFINGIGAYRAPTIIETRNNERITRHKWILDYNLQNFVEDREFVADIISSGKDIFRAERDLKYGYPNTDNKTEEKEDKE